MRIRFLLAMLIGLAMSLAPLAMPAGEAMAAAGDPQTCVKIDPFNDLHGD